MLGDLLARVKFRPGGAAPDPARNWLLRVHELVLGLKPDAWRIKDLARRLGVSEPHLRVKFRGEAGIGLGHYLRLVRIRFLLFLQPDLPRAHGAFPPRLSGENTRSSYNHSGPFRRNTRSLDSAKVHGTLWNWPSIAGWAARMDYVRVFLKGRAVNLNPFGLSLSGLAIRLAAIVGLFADVRDRILDRMAIAVL